MPKNDDLTLKSRLGPEQGDHDACQELQTIDHPAADYPIRGRKPLRMKFSVGTRGAKGYKSRRERFSLQPVSSCQKPSRRNDHNAEEHHRHDDGNDPVGCIVQVQLKHVRNLAHMRRVVNLFCDRPLSPPLPRSSQDSSPPAFPRSDDGPRRSLRIWANFASRPPGGWSRMAS